MMEMGRRTMRQLAPKLWAGRLFLNLDLTTPELPCGREMRLREGTITGQRGASRGKARVYTHPHMTRNLEPLISRLAL